MLSLSKFGAAHEMKRFQPTLYLLVLITLLVAGVAWFGWLPKGSPFDYFSPQARFIRQWHFALRACGNPSSAQALLKRNKEGGEVVVMNDGSWIAVVMEHECCTGAGFNATVYAASTGETNVDQETCYCGWMPLGDEIYNCSKTGIAQFFADVRSRGKHLSRF